MPTITIILAIIKTLLYFFLLILNLSTTEYRIEFKFYKIL